MTPRTILRRDRGCDPMGEGEERRGVGPLSFTVHPAPEGVRIILRGEADLATTSILRDALQEAASLHPAVEVDLRRLDLIETSCVRVLLEVNEHVASQGGKMQVLIGGGTVRRVFEILHLDERLSVHRYGTRGGDDNMPRPS